MKLSFNEMKTSQPDPFIFEDGGTFYIYATAEEGVIAYESKELLCEWNYKGVVTDFAEGRTFWAPSVIKLDDKYYMYVSCITDAGFEFMHVASADSPLGPFKNEKCLYNHFSIDSHMVKTDAGLFLWYAKNNVDCDLIGTRIFVDRFIDPYTPENNPKEVLTPEFDEEKYTPNCTAERNWYTIEGPFWFKEGDWQYLMYSGGCYQDDTYHIGYATAKTDEQDLKKVNFKKVKDNNKFSPLITKNSFEEGTGHHSIIKLGNEYYAIYHGRDYINDCSENYVERRTARICRLIVKDGVITAERFEDHI
jgi:GH43 family beta-xylosidase